MAELDGMSGVPDFEVYPENEAPSIPGGSEAGLPVDGDPLGLRDFCIVTAVLEGLS